MLGRTLTPSGKPSCKPAGDGWGIGWGLRLAAGLQVLVVADRRSDRTIARLAGIDWWHERVRLGRVARFIGQLITGD